MAKLTETEPGRAPLLGLFERAAEQMDEQLYGELRASGFTELRPGHGCVFGNISWEGSRLTEIAEGAQITKQAVGEVASELERIGYLERVPDPTDRRAKILRLTKRGRKAREKGYEIIRRMEREFADRYGVELANALRAALEDYTGLAPDRLQRRRAA